MSVDILSIGKKNAQQVNKESSSLLSSPSINQELELSPKTKRQQMLDSQVQIGLGAKLTPMSNQQKQEYANELSDNDWNLMQRYKAEGYSFEASREMVRQNKELLNPYAQGVNKFKDYQAKEQYYNNTGGTVDPNSNLYKIGTFLQKLGFDDQYGNPLNKLATQYNERYMNEREAMDTLKDAGELNLLERFGWRVQRGLLSAESGIISGLGKIGNAVQGVEDIKSSTLDATLDRAILGYDTDLNFYREEDRRLDEYLWEGVSGGLDTMFWAIAPKMMTAFSFLGETKTGGAVLGTADNIIRTAEERVIKNGLPSYYESLDDQGKEDMLDTVTTLTYMELAKLTKKSTAKLKTTKIGIEYETLKNQFRTAMKRGAEEAKAQTKAEVKNVKDATELYNEQGKVIGKMGPEGQVGAGKSISRVVQAGVEGFKQSFIDRMNTRHGGTIAEPSTEPTGDRTPESVAKPTNAPTNNQGVVGKTKDLATQTWDTVITGLTPEERIRIQNDPYVKEKWEKALAMINEAGMPLEDAFITEQLYNEIGEKIQQTFDEWDRKLENITAYQELRKNTNTYDLSAALPAVEKLLNSNDILVGPSKKLDFGNSKFVSEADMRSVQRAINRIYRDLSKPITAREYLNMRDILKQLASYATVDASRGQSLIRQLRHTANIVAHETIPGLKDADKITNRYFNEIAELKDGWIYKGGDRKGEIRNNFYSIIKNLTGQNRKVMLDRLEKYYPGVGEEIEAIHIVNKVVKAYNKSPQMIKSLGLGGALGGATIGGGLVGALIGAIAGEMINKGIIEPRTKSKRKAAIEKLLSQMSPEAKRKLESIAVRQLTAKEISAEDQAVLDKVADIIRKERGKGLGETALRERTGNRMLSVGGNNTAPKFKEIKFPSRNLYEIATEDPIEKFDGTLTEEQKRQGKLLYQIADKQLDGRDVDSDNEIMAARGKFLVMNQKPGYTKALGLDQGKVNKSIVRWWEENGGASEELKQFNRWINDGAKPQYWFTGISNLITYTNPRRNIDAINYLVKDVKTAENFDKATYKPRIDATIDSLLLIDSHFNHGELNVRFTTQSEMNKYALELAKLGALGEFLGDTLTLVAGQGEETIPHETGHEGDAVIGIELFGADWIRNKGFSDFYATNDSGRAYLKYNPTWKKGLVFKTPEAMEFYKEMLALLDDIQVPEWMKSDNTIMEDGRLRSEYWQMPEEKWARFRQANITLTRQMNQTGKVPKKTYKSDHGDTYDIELYKRWAQLLQKHQELADAGAFHEVEPINRSGISTANGLKDYAPRQLTPEELEHKAGKMIETWGDVVRGFDIDVMLDKFDPDLRKRQKRVEKVKGKDNMYSDNDFMDFFLTLKAMSKDPEFMEGLRLRAERIKKAQENGTAYGSENVTRLYDMLSRKDLKLTAPKGQRDIDVINEERLEPIRRWLIQSGITRSSFRDVFATLGTYYSPDTIQWQNNLEKSAGWDFKRLSVKDLKELEGYIKDLIERGEINATGYDPILGSRRYSQYTINGEMPDRLTDVVERGIGDTFTDKRIKEVANDMWDTVMDPMREILKESIVGWMHVLSSELTEFFGKVYYAMGETYTTDMKERTRAVNEKIKKIGDEMGIALNRDRVVPEQKLQGLNAKLRELMAVGPDLGEYIEKEGEFDYNPARNEWIRDLVKGAYERSESNVAQATTEATKQLVALSNMDVSNFEKQIKNFGGKSPMPSIAITDVNVPHTAFGDLTLIFGKDTVDPKADPRNKIFASDAWTVTFPDIKDAGGFTFDNAKELRELIENKITSNVDNLTLTEAGLDLATRESLENKIVNEILNNAYDTEYLRGWQDVGDTTVENAVDELGLDRYENEGLYQDLQNLVADYVKQHQPTQVIPGYYFKGQIRYDDPKAWAETVDKVFDNLPTENRDKILGDYGKQLLPWEKKAKENGHDKEEADATAIKMRINRDLGDIVEKIDGFPNITPTEAGKEFINLLTEDYGFEKKMATEIAESIFGEIAKERLSKQQFAERIHYQLPLNDGDMGEDFGTMHDKNLGPMLGDMLAHTEDLAENLLDQYDKGYIEAEGDRIIDKLLDEWETDVHDDIENYVVVELRERAIGEEPSMDAEEKWRKEEGEQQTSDIMMGVDASLTDMKMYVKDIVKEQLLVEDVNKDRPVTPENVLEAMRNQGGPRRDVTEGSLRDLVGVEGKEFTDIEQVREKNLAKTTHDDRTGDLSAIEKRYDTIISEIRREFTEGEPDIPMEMSSQVVKQEIAWNYDPDLETFKNNLLEENEMWEIIPDDYLQAIIDCVEMGKQVPVRFSESKPERIVDLYKEVEYILVPKQDLGKVNDIVRGTPLEGKVHMYDRSGFKSERSDRMKSLQKKYGNIFFSMGGVVMPIAMLLMMVNQQEETA